MLSIKSFWKLRSKKLVILCAFDDDREQYSDDDDTLGGWSRWRTVAARTVIGNEISPLHLQCSAVVMMEKRMAKMMMVVML